MSMFGDNRLPSTPNARSPRTPASTPRSSASMSLTSHLELLAGQAVADGALHAGPLTKRTEWLYSWKSRFVVLNTEALAWQHPSSGEWRALPMRSSTKMQIKDGCLVLQAPAEDGSSSLWFKAASPPELRIWQTVVGDLIAALQAEAALARLLARERRDVISTPPFVELPHAGSRNLRERQLAKQFYLGVAPAEDQQAWGSYIAESEWHGPAATRPPLRILSLMRLPPAAAGWDAAHQLAFEEVVTAIGAVGHPFVLPAHLAQVLLSMPRGAHDDDDEMMMTGRRRSEGGG